jgi:hypothetical protein
MQNASAQVISASPSPSRSTSVEARGERQSRPLVISRDFAHFPVGNQIRERQRSTMSQTPGSRRHRRSETSLSPRPTQPGAAAAASASTHPYQTHARHRSELSPRRSRSPERYGGPGPARVRDTGRHRSSFSMSSTSPSAITNLRPPSSTGGPALWPPPTAMSSIREFPHPQPVQSGQVYGQPSYPAGHQPPGAPSVINPAYHPQHQPLPSFSTAMGWTSQAATYAVPASPMITRDPGRGGSKDFSAEFTESSEGSIVAARDLGRERAPRSMMACEFGSTISRNYVLIPFPGVRCRKQKMKCDGPAAAPCRGCRSANVICVFETRTRSSRPKSISTLGSGPPQPLPAIISGATDMPQVHLSSHQASRSLDPFTLPGMSRHPHSGQPISPPYARPRELTAMRPPSGQIMTVERGPPSNPQMQMRPSIATPRPTTATSFVTSASQAPYSTVTNMPPHPSAVYSNQSMSTPTQRTVSPPPQRMPSDYESRLRQIETSMGGLERMRSEFHGLQNTVSYLEIQVRQLTNDLIAVRNQAQTAVSQPPLQEIGSPGHRVPISERIWDAYHAYITSLAPWLPTLSSPNGLSGEVIACLGSRIQHDPEQSPVVRGDMFREELSRLVVSGQTWREEDVLAASVFATWEGQSTLICTAVAQARAATRWSAVENASPAEARYMVELAVMEQM